MNSSDRSETSMNSAETLRTSLFTVEVDEAFTEAVLRLHDNSRLCFCHRVDERWAKSVGAEGREDEGGWRETCCQSSRCSDLTPNISISNFKTAAVGMKRFTISIVQPNAAKRRPKVGQVLDLSGQDAILSYKNVRTARRSDNLML